jgi:hypothetical protein
LTDGSHRAHAKDRWLSDKFDYYQELHVDENATPKEIQESLRFLSKHFYPDKETDPKSKARANEAQTRINIAKGVLSDPDQRKRYDTWRRAGEATSHGRGDHRPATVALDPEIVNFGTVEEFTELSVRVVNTGDRATSAKIDPTADDWWKIDDTGPAEDDPDDTAGWLIISVWPGGPPGAHTVPVTVQLDDSTATLTFTVEFESPSAPARDASDAAPGVRSGPGTYGTRGTGPATPPGAATKDPAEIFAGLCFVGVGLSLIGGELLLGLIANVLYENMGHNILLILLEIVVAVVTAVGILAIPVGLGYIGYGLLVIVRAWSLASISSGWHRLRASHLAWATAAAIALVVLVMVSSGSHSPAAAPTSTRSSSSGNGLVSSSSTTSTTLAPPTTTTNPDGTPLQGTGVSNYGDYQVAISVASLQPNTLVLNFDATGPDSLLWPDGSCLEISDSGGQDVRETNFSETVNVPGQRYAGTMTFPIPGPGTYEFVYGCSGEYPPVPVLSK